MSSPPLYQVKLTYTGPNLIPSFFDANFVGSSLFGPGVYDAWCADRDINIDLAATGGGSFSSTFNAYAYSIYEPAAFGSAFPSIEQPGNFASVNWLLSQNFSAPGAGYTFGEVQAAVWQLLGDDWAGSTSIGTPDPAKVSQLLALASGQSAYRPDITDDDPTNDNTLLLLDLYKADGTVQQPIIIEIKSAALGDRVWHDENRDGLQDVGEQGIAGAVVRLVRDANGDGNISADEVLATTITDDNGNYKFTGLTPGLDYQVQFFTPTGYAVSSPRQSDGNSASGSNSDGPLSDVVVLAPGEWNKTVDAGFFRDKGSIGNFVWNDTNNDGIQDVGEAGIGGVTLSLIGFAGGSFVTLTTTTAADGSYLFDNLLPGSYQVTVDAANFGPGGALEGFNQSPSLQGSNTEIDSNGSPSVIPLELGQNDLSIDFGFNKPVPLGSIGDKVWEDTNGNGVQDAGEAGVGGVIVRLYDCSGAGEPVFITQTTTDANGNYTFADLAPGKYTVQFVSPTGYVFTTANIGDDAFDSDAGTDGFTGCYTLAPGENNTTVDAGLVRPASLGDWVWEDTNGNGVQDAGEAGVAGVIVRLYDCANGGTPVFITQTTTDASGNYSFTNLKPGQYSVQFVSPAGYMFTTANVGNDALDSDAGFDGFTGCYTLTSGENNTTVDAGLIAPRASLGDTVWEDMNYNGIQDAGEAGVAGVTVRLLDSGGSVVSSTTTDASGKYLFENLNPGDYRIRVERPSGYYFTKANVGSDDTVDSDVNATSGRSQLITLGAGQNDLTWDAGLYRKAALGDRVWEDSNANGIQDAGELGVSGVTVNLLDSLGTVIATTATDSMGNYQFWALDPGEYRIQVVRPSGYSFTTANIGSNDAVDSDVDIWAGVSDRITLVSGQEDMTWDAGLIAPKASLGDTVWEDRNYNGIQDAGEVGVAGVTVRLLNSAGSIVATTTTNSSGKYLFEKLNPGDYRIEVVRPSGYFFTRANIGTNDGVDSDVDVTTGRSELTTLVAGENDLTWDAGLYRKASLGDTVWEDRNANGIQDTGEVGVAGVTVRLLNSTGSVLATTTTNSSGKYLFDNLNPGDYRIEVVKPSGYSFTTANVGSNDAVDSDVDRTTGHTQLITLASGQTDLTWDAGIIAPKASLGDTVWEDSNYNGIQDAGEVGVAGVTVRLLNSSGSIVATTTTNSSGKYLFSNLNPGDYRIEVVKPSAYFFTKANVGSNNNVDSDVSVSTGRSALTTLIAGENDLSWDAGLYRKASIGDKVWEETNYNDIQDSTERGIRNVKVQLIDTNGVVIATTYTNSSGNYLFSNLDPGWYRLAFDKSNVSFDGYNLSDWWWVRRDTGSNDARDSDVGSTTSRVSTNRVLTDWTFLESGENDMSWDAGITPIAIDLNGDGVQTIARADFNGSFDILGTGTPVSTGWLSDEDGFLAVDRNGNGKIDDVSELFGGLNKGDGFALLATYDTNGDGVIDANDAAFGDLRIWRDANSDGRTDEGELITLADAGIVSLNVEFIELPFLDANKNLHLERGTANLLDGTQTSMTDVYFNVAKSDLEAAGVSGTSLADLLGDIFATASASSGEIDFFDSLGATSTVAANSAATDCVGCLDKSNLGDPLASLFEPAMMV